MSERRFPSARTAIEHWRRMAKRGVLVGISSERIPMMEFECDDAALCAMGLKDPLRIANWQPACDRVFREVAKYFGHQLAFLSVLYQISLKPDWERTLCPTKTGVRKAPFVIRVGNKSIHTIGIGCIPRGEWFKKFYAFLSGIEWSCVDSKYIEAVLLKGYATLRVTPKTRDKVRVTEWDIPKNVVVGEFLVENLKPVLAVYELYRPVWDFVNYVFVVFRQFGVDVRVLGFKARL